MRTSLAAAALLAALGVGTLSAAAPSTTSPLLKGDAAAGAQKAVVCQACHGPNGNSTAAELGPSLAGQSAVYASEQLKLFKAAHRANEIMIAQAQAIETEQDMADLAAYFAAQTPTGLEADPSYWKAGEALYRGGDTQRQIPSCKACHGPVGRGNPAAGYPALRAQHAAYTLAQLRAYAAETRYVDRSGAKTKSRNGHMMTTISKRLTEEDMRNLASYIQGMR